MRGIAEKTGPETGVSHAPSIDPLLECLVILVSHYGHPQSNDALVAGLPLVKNRMTPELFVRSAQRTGFSAKIVDRKIDQISSYVLPAVLLLHDSRACILKSIDSEHNAHVLLPDEVVVEQIIPASKLEELYTGHAIYVQPEVSFDDRVEEVNKLGSQHWFWGTLSRSWRIYRDVLIASFMINVFALASPLFIMNVYDRVVPNNAIETLWVLAAGVFIVFLFDFVLRWIRGYFIDLAGKKSDILISSAIFEKVMGLKMAVRPPSVGAFSNNLREFESIREFITSITITALVDVPFIVLFIAMISYIGGPLVFVPLTTIPILLIYSYLIQAPLRENIERVFRASSQKNATLVESLTGIEALKTLGAEGQAQRKWEEAVAYIARYGVRSRLLSSSAVNTAVFLQQISMILIVAYGVYLINDGELSMGGLIACVILVGRAMSPMAQVANLAVNYHRASTALKSLDTIMDLPVEREKDKQYVRRRKLHGNINFQNVDFTYPGQQTQALSGVSFAVKQGQHVAIIGRIGTGKSTIEKMIMGLYEPEKGAVRIDGIDTRQIDPIDLRRNIGYVPQDAVLFYGTVRDNITYGATSVSDDLLLRAAQTVGIHEFIDRHPLGYDMQVGERGEGLSGGQRKGIAIARALLLDPPILLMDEPSNSMDNTSEKIFRENLKKYAEGKTLFIITHRLSMMELVDRILVIDNGRIVADGPKEDVLEMLKKGKIRTIKP